MSTTPSSTPQERVTLTIFPRQDGTWGMYGTGAAAGIHHDGTGGWFNTLAAWVDQARAGQEATSGA